MEIEKLGSFYLGKEFDVTRGQIQDRLLAYDARDLTTHAVCVGMTGSGKTGLCIDLLEEAAIDGVPALIIDVKGDMSNLLLTFPELRPGDFLPWVNRDDASRKGLTLEEFSAQQAELWRNGLAQWGQDAARVARLSNSVDRVIYTPGSQAGVQLSMLQSFDPPPLSWDTEAELLREQIQGIVAAILGLIGLDADPVKSRENILLATLLEEAWKHNRKMDLATLISDIQQPPVKKLGVFDLDTFIPTGERFKLAMSLNSILAAPGFQTWLEGQPLDVAGLLASPDGRPRHSVFYIAHLNQAERMFFVTMLFNKVVTWMRAQSGTTSLRAILYMDEIFGFFPPVANPPSKAPMLTLLKQARAFGLGVVLVTQNPVDLDYKGLTNAGTWFIGRLQTDRDKKRVLDGLESASVDVGLDRQELEALISGLGQRVFLMHNVHEEHPVTFQTRWAMSYLRGPLTRPQVQQLLSDRHIEDQSPAPQRETGPKSTATEAQLSSSPPPLGAGLSHTYLPVDLEFHRIEEILRQSLGTVEVKSRQLVYSPHIGGMGTIHFVDRRQDIHEQLGFALMSEPPQGHEGVEWQRAFQIRAEPRSLLSRGQSEACYLPVPGTVNDESEIKELQLSLTDHLYRTQRLPFLYYPRLKITSRPGESERDFKTRLSLLVREKRDAEIDSLQDRYEHRLDSLRSRLRRAEITLQKKEQTASSRKREVVVSVGETILGMFLGRSSRRVASSSLSKYRMSSTAEKAAEEAAASVHAMEEEIKQLESELSEAVAEIENLWEPTGATLEEKPLTPRKTDIDIDFFGLVWVPAWHIDYVDSRGLSGTTSILAVELENASSIPGRPAPA